VNGKLLETTSKRETNSLIHKYLTLDDADEFAGHHISEQMTIEVNPEANEQNLLENDICAREDLSKPSQIFLCRKYAIGDFDLIECGSDGFIADTMKAQRDKYHTQQLPSWVLL
jgi:hypothetical protein